MDNFLGQITGYGFNFAPRGWLPCSGQLLPINQYTALFSLLGTTYGGNGVSNFQLPNLNGTVALGFGQGQGLSPYQLGQVLGTENVTLTSTTIPSHSHSMASANIQATNAGGDQNTPGGNVWAGNGNENVYGPASNTPVQLASVAGTANVQPAGGSQPHENRQPFLTINFCIATTGIFPSRN